MILVASIQATGDKNNAHTKMKIIEIFKKKLLFNRNTKAVVGWGLFAECRDKTDTPNQTKPFALYSYRENIEERERELNKTKLSMFSTSTTNEKYFSKITPPHTITPME